MRYWLFLIGFTCSLFAADATIEVIKQADRLATFAIEDGSTGTHSNLEQRFFKSLLGDMNVLSLFNTSREHTKVDFSDAEVARENRKIDYVLRYKIMANDDDSYRTDIKFFDHGDLRIQKRYTISKEKLYVFVAHTIAYDINTLLGEPPVEWIKSKVLISKLTSQNTSEIIITDYTLTYQHVMIKGGLNVFPQWANKRKDAFYYTSLSGFKPTLFRIDTRTGQKQKVVDSDGMMVCSDVSSDGRKLLLTMAPNGQPDLYLFDVPTKHYERLTYYNGIDVNGQFMSDEGRIVFISNRLGYPNVFTKKIGEKSVEQMVYYGKSNVSCSAHGDYIVYKARETSNAFSANTFNLHLISTKSDFIRRLTATGINEFPRFSDDGKAILFIKNYQNQSSIGIVRLEYNKNYLFPLKVGKIQSLDW